MKSRIWKEFEAKRRKNKSAFLSEKEINKIVTRKG